MGFFNKKELAQIKRLQEEVERKDAINSELKELLEDSDLGIDLLNGTIKNLEKTVDNVTKEKDDLYTDYLKVRSDNIALNDSIVDKDFRIKELESDITHTINICSELEKQLNSTVKKALSLKEAMTEIAEYDFDRHKKAYLLNDFFQQRAKKALEESE